MLRNPLYGQNLFQGTGSTPRIIREDLVICSFGSAGLKKLAREIHYLRAGDIAQTLVCDNPFEIIRPRKAVEVSRRTTFHVFESARTLVSFQSEIKARFSGGEPGAEAH
jgi:hypothetical protein